MTSQAKFIKWIVYFLAFLPIWIAEIYVFGRYPVGGIIPYLFVLSVVAVGVLEVDPSAATIYGLFLGILQYSLTGDMPICIALLALTGCFAGQLKALGIPQNFVGYFIACLAAVLVFCICKVFPLLFLQRVSFLALLPVFMKQWLVTCLFTVFVYPLEKLAYHFVGGNKLAS